MIFCPVSPGRAAVGGARDTICAHVDRLLEATFLAEREHFWFKGFRQFITPFIERGLAGVSAPRMLDCGCGTGSNLALLKRYGHASGFDLTSLGLQYRASRAAIAWRAPASRTSRFAPRPSTW